MTAAPAAVFAAAAVLLSGEGGWPSRRARGVLAQRGAAPPPRGTAVDWLLPLTLAAVAWTAIGPVTALLAAVGALVAGRVSRWRARRAAVAACTAALPAVCRTLAAELAAGVPATAALVVAAGRPAPEPLRQVLASAAASGQLGIDPADVLAARPPPGCEGLRLLAACWRVCTSAGGGLGVAVSRLGGALQADREAAAAIAAELAGPRLSAQVMAGLPALGLLLGAAFGAEPLRFLLRTPAGLACLGLGALLDAAGLWWVSVLARRALP